MKALLVIDMLNDFLEPSGTLFCGEHARKIIPFVKEKIEEFRNEGAKVIFVTDCHDEDDKEFERFPKHSVKGTEGAKIIKELEFKDKDIRIYKTRYSGFFNTELDEILKSENIQDVYLVGVCTSICIMETASGLANRDIKHYVFKSGVADITPEDHEYALKRMEDLFGTEIV